MSSCWLITGASSGLGLAMAMCALRRGKKVVAATRNPVKAAQQSPELEKEGGVWLELDINKESAREVVAQAVEKHGVDVLVNNAAFPLLGAFEDMSDEEFASSFNPNVFGVHRTIRGALPSFRARRAGTIVNISSGAGFWGNASRSAYSSTKFALGGLSEVLSRELAPFGIRVLVVEPGAFRTPFGSSMQTPAAATKEAGGNGLVSKAYEGSQVEALMNRSVSLSGGAKGDPAKAAKVIADAVDQTGWAAGKTFLRMPLGPDSVGLMKQKIEILQREYEEYQEACSATNLDEASG